MDYKTQNLKGMPKRPPLPRPLLIKLTKRMLERTVRYVQ